MCVKCLSECIIICVVCLRTIMPCVQVLYRNRYVCTYDFSEQVLFVTFHPPTFLFYNTNILFKLLQMKCAAPCLG
jgi:hypothetical protein